MSRVLPAIAQAMRFAAVRYSPTTLRWPRVARPFGPYTHLRQRRHLRYVEADQHRSFWFGSGGASWNVINGPVLSPNTGYHVVTTWAAGARLMTLFLNGQLIDVKAGANVLPNTSQPMRIGAGRTEANFASEPFNESVDNVAVYPMTLSPQVVQARYLAGITP